jgi:hypothetical protein
VGPLCGVGIMIVRDVIETVSRYINKLQGVAMNENQAEAKPRVFILKDEIASLKGKVSNNVELGQEIQKSLVNRLTEPVPEKVILDLNGNSGLEANFLNAAFSDLNSSFNEAVRKQGSLSSTRDYDSLDYLELKSMDIQLLWWVSHAIQGTLKQALEAELAY